MRIAILAAAVVWAGAVPAQARLVKNIGTTNLGSYPESMERYTGSVGNLPRLTRVGKWTYFNAWIDNKREVLYRTDGTAAGTERVIDLNTSSARGKGGALNPAVIGNKLLFVVRIATGYGLYATDSLTNKTTQLTAGWVQKPIVFKSEVWFAKSGAPWKSDGTVSGTRPAGISSTYFIPLFVLNGELYFHGSTTQSWGLYKTDGSAAGTKYVGLQYEFAEPVVSGGLVYFDHQRYLYVSDMTPAGTRRISGPIFPRQLVPVQGGVFFSASTTTNGHELAFSDGKTVTHFDLNPGKANSDPYGLMAMGKGLAFSAKGVDPVGQKYVGVEPWLFDGTTFVVHDLNPNGDSSPASLIAHGTKVLVGARNGLFAIDRTTSTRVHDVYDGRYMTSTPKGIVFAGSALADIEPWITDGTRSGTRLIKNIVDAPDIRADAPVGNLIAGGDRVYFTARHNHREQWESDGSTAGTRQIGAWPLDVKETHLVWNNLLFVEGESAGARLPMAFDLRTKTSLVLKRQGNDLTRATGFVVFRDAVWFLADEGLNRNLYKTDGKNVQRVHGVATASSPGDGSMALYGDRLYFRGIDSSGVRLWSSDGTTAGTGPVTNIVPRDPRCLTVLGDKLLFVGLEGSDWDLYSTDGTAKGTVGVGLKTRWGIRPGRFGGKPPFSLEARGLARTLDRVFFVTDSSLNRPNQSGNAVWSSDGTRAGTVMLAPTETPPWIATTATHVHFSATHPTNRFKSGFYKSAGSPHGMYFSHTLILQGKMTVVGQRVFLVQRDPNYRAAGSLSSMDPTLKYHLLGKTRATLGTSMVAMRGELFFAGQNRDTGTELYATPIGAYTTDVIPGCSRTTPPILTKTRPVMGKSVTVKVRNIPPAKTGFYVTGFSSPSWTHLGGHCQTVLDLTKPLLLVGIRPNTQGHWWLTYTLPADPSMVGIIHPGQVVVGPTATAPFGMDFSNAIHVHLDRN